MQVNTKSLLPAVSNALPLTARNGHADGLAKCWCLRRLKKTPALTTTPLQKFRHKQLPIHLRLFEAKQDWQQLLPFFFMRKGEYRQNASRVILAGRCALEKSLWWQL